LTEVEVLQVRRNRSERSNVLGLKCVDRFVVEDVGTEKRRHEVAARLGLLGTHHFAVYSSSSRKQKGNSIMTLLAWSGTERGISFSVRP
jgi:hypothetical protein